MNNNKFTTDLTTGSVWKQLIVFAVPFFISNFIQSAYSVADMMILGNFCGENSISAVNTSSQIAIIVTNIAMGLSTGGTIMIGQYLGANRTEDIKKSISTLLITLFTIAICFTCLLLCFTNPVLQAMQTPTESFAEARSYLIINLIGLLFVYGYNSLSAIMRGLGDSKTPMKFVFIASITNIVLDFAFIGVLKMGAAGAALATIIAQALSMILCIIYLKQHNFIFDFKLSSFVFDKDCFKTLINVGLPNAITLVVTNFSFLLLIAILNDIGGVTASAASGIVNKFHGFAHLPSSAISASTAAMISQNMGANKQERVTQAMRCCMLLCCIVSIFAFAIANIFPRQIFLLFGAEEALIETGTLYIRTFSFEYAFLPFIVSFFAVFNGTGNGWMTMITDITASFLIRIPMACLMGIVLDLGIMGIGACVPAATGVGMLIALGFYLSGHWKKSRVIQEKQSL